MGELRIPGDIRVRIEALRSYIRDHGTIANNLGIPRAWVEHTCRGWREPSKRACDRGNGQPTKGYAGPTDVERRAPGIAVEATHKLLLQYQLVYRHYARDYGVTPDEAMRALMSRAELPKGTRNG